MASAGSFMTDIIDGVKDLKGLRSNKAINAIGTNMGGAFQVGNEMIANKQTFKNAMTKTFANNADDVINNGAKADLNYGKIAGSYIGASAAMRVASGGGVYRDKNGNSNLIGVPFV